VFDVRGATEAVDQALAEDQELRHGLGGRAGLRDHVEQRLGRIELVEELADQIGIDVVEHEQPRQRSARAEVVVGRIERLLQRDRPQRRTADAEHDHVLETSVHARRVVEDLLMDLALVRQIEPAQVVGAPRLHCAHGVARELGHAIQFRGRDAVLRPDRVGQSVRVVEHETSHRSSERRTGAAREYRAAARGSSVAGPRDAASWAQRSTWASSALHAQRRSCARSSM
jgi:hypothetical protein